MIQARATSVEASMSDADTAMSNAEVETISIDDAEMPMMSVEMNGNDGKKNEANAGGGSRRLRMARGITVDSGAADPVMPRRMVRGRGNKIRPSAASRAGVHYVSASANRIKNGGETDLHFDTVDGALIEVDVPSG